jgi:hypothetical protein
MLGSFLLNYAMRRLARCPMRQRRWRQSGKVNALAASLPAGLIGRGGMASH